MKASYHKYILNFKQPSGTSRGVMTSKETWFIILEKNFRNPPCLLAIKIIPVIAIKNNKNEKKPTTKRPVDFKNKEQLIKIKNYIIPIFAHNNTFKCNYFNN